ncbi:MFS transporter, partial [Streptomyces sp. WAC01526]|uniref:MFS transporter n=1 Tax=Streptomyces sp. WAC01526 TaxID=2588709 RepID=UPI0021CC5463
RPQEPPDPRLRSAVRKIFRRVVPLFFVMFVANYVDRVNIGFAQDQLRADAGISAAAFGFGAGLFFVAYARSRRPVPPPVAPSGSPAGSCSPTRSCCCSAGSTSPSRSPSTRSPSGCRASSATSPVSGFQVGLLVAVPWLCALAAVYVTGRASDRTGRRRPFLAGALLAGSAGTLLATLVSPWLGLAALCLAAMGFKTSSPVFWTIPQSYLDARIAAPAIALVNSLGNLGGFVSPTAFGILQDATGSTRGGLIGLLVVGVLAALSVALVRGGGHRERTRGRRPRAGDHGPGRGPVRGGPARVR